MNNLKTNALRIAELLGYEQSKVEHVLIRHRVGHNKKEILEEYYSYNGLMPIVFECNYVQDDLDIEIVIYGSGLDVHLNDEDILITTFDTKEGFIESLQLAVIKYLELKNG